MTILALLLAVSGRAQDSQFLFDSSGNLQAQSGANQGLPKIIGQPQMQIVIPGQPASFSVGVADTSGVSYQWFFNTSAIGGATGDSLLLTNVSSADEGVYWVAVSNAFGSVASVLANLYIDSRGCGMPDSWQLEYFGNLNQPATGDYDGDGVPNLQEFLDGTNPTNAASALYRIALLDDGGSVVVSPSQSTYASGQVVTLTATGSSSAPFHAWTGDVTTRSNSITVTMTNNMTLFARFLPFTLEWTNPVNIVSGDWNAASNWTPNLAPASDESALLRGGANVTDNSNVDLVNLTFGDGTGGAALSGSGRITIAGTGVWYAGTMAGSGATVVKPGANVSIVNNMDLALSGRTFENAGSILWGGGHFTLGGIFTNDPGGQFEIGGAASFDFGGGTARFDNAGLFILGNNAATTFSAVAFNDYGMVSFPGGTLTLGGGGFLDGPIGVPAGSAINFQSGTFTSSSNLALTGPGTLIVNGGNATLAGTVNLSGSNIFGPAGGVDFTGNYTCTNNTMVILGGGASFDGTGVVSPTVINLIGGALGGAQNVTVGGVMNWTGGNMNGAGRTSIPPGAALITSNASFLSMTSRTLDNGGTVVWQGAGAVLMVGAVITNRAGALFNVQNSVGWSGGGAPRFDNAGTFQKSASSGTMTLSGIPFTNYGTVDIQNGVLAANGGYGSTPNSTLNCGIAGTLPGTNYGQLQVHGAVTLSGGLSVNFANSYVPATNDSFTLVSAGSRNGAFSTFLYPSREVSMALNNTATSVIAIITNVIASFEQPLLHLDRLSATSELLSWSTNFPNYHLEFSASVPATNWAASGATPGIVGANFAVTNSLSSTQGFYRLSSVAAPGAPLARALNASRAISGANNAATNAVRGTGRPF